MDRPNPRTVRHPPSHSAAFSPRFEHRHDAIVAIPLRFSSILRMSHYLAHRYRRYGGIKTITALCLLDMRRWRVRPASRIERRIRHRTCRADAVGQADGEHCSTFRCEEQRNKLRSRADARPTCGRAAALSRAVLTIQQTIILWRSPEGSFREVGAAHA